MALNVLNRCEMTDFFGDKSAGFGTRRESHMSTVTRYALVAVLSAGVGDGRQPVAPARPADTSTGAAAGPDQFNDSHFHLTNYIQEGTDVRKYLEIMGTRVGRSTLFGIPLQQTWDYGNTGDFAPTYYLQTDAPLYYYSFTDAFIAMAYRSLTPAAAGAAGSDDHRLQSTDMYAVDHIRRVLTTFPGVFPASANSPSTRSSSRRRWPAEPRA